MSLLHSYRDLLQEYFDEGLDPVHEETLFAELGRNPELRTDFSQMMRLQRTVQADVAHIKAPASATADLFQRIAAPVPAPQPSATASVSRRVAAFAATALLSVLATTVFFLLRDFNRDDSRGVVHMEFLPPAPVVHSSAQQPAGLSAGTAGTSALYADKVPLVRQPAARRRNSYSTARRGELPLAVSDDRPVFKPVENSIAVSPCAYTSMPPAEPVARSISSSDELSGIGHSRKFGTVFSAEDTEAGGVVLSLHGVGYGEMSTPIRQMSMGVLYIEDENHAFGIEAGQQSFTSVSAIDVDGEQVEFRSIETLPWAMAVYRLSLAELGFENTVYPFAQMGAGIARGGGIGKAQLGIVVQPEYRVTFSFGLESTALVRAQKLPVTTFRWTYGVGVRL